ncbi:MAG TPA: molybdopterin cofactor-binding domain-containing protein [Terriglobia bacterium]|nr:molybdopterin cofactor-binding domain-containing protein [Terriglobia bacterium]
MIHDSTNASPPEPERYELNSVPTYHFELARREFFRIFGGGMVIACILEKGLAAQESGRGGRGLSQQLPQDIASWLHIDEDGGVTAYTGKVEVGQNSRTALTQAVAEELRVPPDSIRMVMGDTELSPFDMGTFGSRTTPTMNPQLRRVAATARDLLIDLAAEAWGTHREGLIAGESEIRDPGNQRAIAYKSLLKGKKLARAIPADDPLRPPAQWTVMGSSVPKVDGKEFVTGKHAFPSDVKMPGMLVGKILRPPSIGATLDSLDTRQAETMVGVIVVHDGDFVGVAAPSERVAEQAIAAIRAEWKAVPQPSGKELYEYLKKNAESSGSPDERIPAQGLIEDGLASADQRLKTTYTIAYIAHAPLEPRAAVAEWKEGKLLVWTGTQRPFGVRSELAQAFRIPEDQVHVRMPDMGSGYGGKHTGETAVEAARLAKGAGRPVKLVWTREEEFSWAYFRPAGVIEVRSGVKQDGTITAWEFHNYNSGASGISTPYDIPNQRTEFHASKSPLRQGSYRGLAATANHFVRESHMDELAHAVNMDPLEFRLKNLKDTRLRGVFEAASTTFGWGKARKRSGQGFGLGGGTEKGGYVATCVEVSVDGSTGQVKIVRAVTAFDCGAVVNPDQLRNQIEGAIVMGIGGALFEAIEFEDGRILNGRFSRYRVPRFSDVPEIEVVLVDQKDLPSAGAGETPLVGLAPAVGNAIFDATGIRLRSLPMAPEGVKV